MAEQKQAPTEQEDRNERYARHHRHYGAPAIFAGLLLILLGVLLFLAAQGYITWDRWWQYFLIGLGLILIIDSLIRYQRESSRGFSVGRIVAGIILIGIGTAFLFYVVSWWPLILVAIGIAILVGGIWRHSQNR